MTSEMCGYDTTLVCLKKSRLPNQNRRCLTCHIYLKRTKEFDERLTEPQIKELIWSIIKNGVTNIQIVNLLEIKKGNFPNQDELFKEYIQDKINELLNEHEAILVYQP